MAIGTDIQKEKALLKTLRIFLVLLIAVILLGMMMGLFTAVHAATIVVNSPLDTADPTPANGICDADPGTAGNQCTLRAAIQTAQGSLGSDTIHFANSMNILLNSNLPGLAEDGLTIEAEAGQTVRINGQGSVNNIFRITGSHVTISNVVIYGSGPFYSDIWINDADEGVVIANNLLGDDDPAAGGCGQSDSAYGGIYISSSTSAPTATHRVWIYGNTIECYRGSPGDGITLFNTNAVFIGNHLEESIPAVPGNVIRQNQLGLANYGGDIILVSGNVIENNTGHGIAVESHDLFIIGCLDAAIDRELCRNKIRGNGGAGVYTFGMNSGRLGLAANWIGLADDGITAVPNQIGLHLHTDNVDTLVISNTISGNIEDGIRIQESRGEHSIWGNVIGLGADGVTAVPNGSHGIALFDDAGDTHIGEQLATFGNTISGNDGFGILVSNSPSTTIDSNTIGLALDGVTPRGNNYDGIYVLNSDGTTIGSLTSAAYYGTQKIAYNGDHGVYLENANHTGIGPTTDVTHNQLTGIYIYNSQENSVFPNLVAHNGDEGIQLSGNLSLYNRIIPFVVRDNGRLPINFGPPGLEPNDPNDPDPGPNTLLNVPEVTLTNGTVITGTVCASCFVAVFEATADPTADGGGGIYRAFTTADAGGVWSIDLAAEGLAFHPVTFMTLDGWLAADGVNSSPLSPMMRLGYTIYAPTILK